LECVTVTGDRRSNDSRVLSEKSPSASTAIVIMVHLGCHRNEQECRKRRNRRNKKVDNIPDLVEASVTVMKLTMMASRNDDECG
jgi:hypothetical protein